MTMPKRVLLACELGSGPRALDRLLPLASGLAAAGHSVTLALRDPQIIAGFAAANGWVTVIAPAWRAAPPPGFIATGFADILLQCGYATPEALRGLLAGWRQLFTNAQPDLLIADFSPTAMLAAQETGLVHVAVGNGFAIPPDFSPMPGLRPWDDLPQDRIIESEGRVLAIINAIHAAAGGVPLTRLADIFNRADDRFLCTFAELDHYEGRGDAEYFGEVFDAGTGMVPAWAPGPAERVFACLDARHPGFNNLIAALDRLALPSVIEATQITPELAQTVSRGLVRVVAERVDRTRALAECDIVACQDNMTVAPALLASRPVLMMPWPIEQFMTLHRVAKQGLGTGVPPAATVDVLEAALRRLLDDAPARLRVANFARTYHGYTTSLAVDTMREACLDLLG